MKKSLTLLTFFLAFGIATSSCGKKEETEHEKTSQVNQTKVENKAPKPLTELADKNPHGMMEGMPPGHPPINNLLEGHPPVHGNMGMPEGHDELMAVHSGKNLTKFDKPINIPPEVVNTWKYATIKIVDRTTGKVVKTEKVSKDSEVKYGDLDIKILYIVPHLVLGDGYTSGSNEPLNPAILVEVKSNGKTIYAGPIYEKFPEMYNINHPKYVLILAKISKK